MLGDGYLGNRYVSVDGGESDGDHHHAGHLRTQREGGCAWFVFGGVVQTGGAFNCSSIPAKVVHLPRETLIRLPSAESADVSRLHDSYQSSQSVSEESLLQAGLGSTKTVFVCVLARAVWLQEKKN